MLHVSSLRAAPDVIASHGIRRVISILGPETPHRTFVGVDAHLKLTFNDISLVMEGMVTPGDTHINSLIAFVRGWDRAAPMLIHCWAGVSRSTAAAYITQCVLNPRADEIALAEALREVSPSATPNRMMVALADEALGRNGRMLEGVAKIGRGADAYEGGPFTWSLQKG